MSMILRWLTLLTVALAVHARATDRFLMIGIDHYSEGKSGMKDLHGSRDALAMKALVASAFGVAEKDVVLLLDRQATKNAIESAIRDLTAKAVPGDRIFLFYSGHGTTIPAETQTRVRSAILPFDAVGDGTEFDVRTLVTGAFVRDQLKVLREKGVRNVTVVFDSCQSGAMTRGFTAKGKIGVAVAGAQPADPGADLEVNDFHFIGAAKPGQLAYELLDGSGILTKAIIDVVRNWSRDSLPGEKLDFRSLSNAIASRVREISFEAQAPEQNPAFVGAMSRVFLGSESVVRQPSFTTSLIGGKLTINAGRALGVRERHVFAIYKRGSRSLDALSQVGTAEVAEAREFDSDLRPVQGFRGEAADLSGCPAVLIDARGDAATEIQLVGEVPPEIRRDLAGDPLLRLLADSKELKILAPNAALPGLVPAGPTWRMVTAAGRELGTQPASASVPDVSKWIVAIARRWSLERALLNLRSESPEIRVEIQIVEVETSGNSVSRIRTDKITGEISGGGRFVLRVRASGSSGLPFPGLSAYISILDISKNEPPQAIWPAGPTGFDPEGTRVPADGVWRYIGLRNSIVDGQDLRTLYVWRIDAGTPPGDEFLKLLATQEYVDLSAVLLNSRGPGDASPLGRILRAYRDGQPIPRSGSAGAQNSEKYSVATAILHVLP